MPTPVLIPLLNPNEPEALLAALHVTDGQRVAHGDLLCTLETTKSTADLHAEAEGYIAGLRLSQGESTRAGEILCYLAESPGWAPPAESGQGKTSPASGHAGPQGEAVPEGLRITEPALTLARSHKVDLAALPIGPLVTEDTIRSHLASMAENGQAETELAFPRPKSAFDPTGVVVYGGGGHGKMVIDLLRALGAYRIAGIVDDGRQAGETVLGVPVLGGSQSLAGLYDQGVRLAANAVGGIGSIATRIKVFTRLAYAGFVCPTLVHPTAYIDPSASLAPGAQVFVHAYVGGEAQVGFGSIINTGVILSHDCQLGDYVNISPGAILAGEVQVGSGTLIGMGVTVNLGVKVGAGARIGNGATVKGDVPPGGVVRAGTIWPA